MKKKKKNLRKEDTLSAFGHEKPRQIEKYSGFGVQKNRVRQNTALQENPVKGGVPVFQFAMTTCNAINIDSVTVFQPEGFDI